jgi:lipoyl(octanoyl) transferase
MDYHEPTTLWEEHRNRSLDVYLLPTTDWSDVVSLQRWLVYEMAGEPRSRAALVLCEHFPVITIGRQGSRSHLHADDSDLVCQLLDVHWTNRGGGCWLHGPGQLVVYPIVPIDPTRSSLRRYRDALYQTMLNVLCEFGIPAVRDAARLGIVVGEREIGHVGIAVTSWVAYHGCYLNVSMPLDRYEWIQPNPFSHRKMSSMLRELRLPIRTTAVRESFLRHFMELFGFRRHVLCRWSAGAKRAAYVTTG